MVYKFVVLSDEDESFVREFEFLDSHTLMDFHNMIQEELEFDKSQMASFYLATDNWEKEEEFTLSFYCAQHFLDRNILHFEVQLCILGIC